MEPLLKSAYVRKQEAEELGYQGKEVAESVKQHQTLDTEERAACRNIRMAELLSESSSGDFDALVDLIVKEQFINACSEELAVYLLER